MSAKLKTYLLPGLAAAVLLGGFFVVGTCLPNRPKAKHASADAREMEVVGLPHGRVLYVVVESDGCFFGQDFVPFLDVREYLRAHATIWQPEFVVVCGTDRSNFGRVVETLDSVRTVLKVPSTMETRTLPEGTRRGPIETTEPLRRPY